MYMEQCAGLRKMGTVGTVKTHALRHEVPRVLKAVLTRRDLLFHLRKTFPKMSSYLAKYDTDSWFYEEFKVDKHGHRVDQQAVDATSSQDMEEDSEIREQTIVIPASSYSCHSPLISLVERLFRNTLEPTLCKLSMSSLPGKALDLTAPGIDAIKVTLDQVAEKYRSDFPVEVAQPAGSRVMHDQQDKVMEVVTEVSIEDNFEYNSRLAKYNAEAEEHEARAIRGYVEHRVFLFAAGLHGDSTLASKIKKAPLLQDKKRKLFIYDSTLDGRCDVLSAKKRRLNVFSGSGPSLAASRLEARCAAP
jgi:hypothetical protein